MKTVPIEFKQVHDSYVKVKKGGKATGVDSETVLDFEKNIAANLYLIHNRLSSGSYFPPAVRTVEIPKKDGKTRKLGIPTLRDKIAQQVVKDHMEKQIEPLFHNNSYGYRPMRDAKDALAKVKENCRRFDWVIDMDIKGFFDEIDHELMLKGLEHVVKEKWVITYVERWLKAPSDDGRGNQQERTKGTPQGGVISPLLANLFLHYAFDMWMNIHFPNTRFVRYADDIIIHCITKEESERVLTAITGRLAEVKLRVNEEKTKIVYCKDYWRQQNHKEVQFGFLGFSYQPRKTMSKHGNPILTFTPAVSMSNQTKIKTVIGEAFKRNAQSDELIAIAKVLNRKIQGWINYYGGHYNRPLITALNQIDKRLIKWLMIKHKIFYRKAFRMRKSIMTKHPHLFAHWNSPYGPKSYQTTRAV